MSRNYLQLCLSACLLLPLPTAAQQSLSMTVAQTSATTLLSDYSFAGRQSRSLQSGGWTLNQRVTPRLFGWYGQQSLLATGASRGDHFAAHVDRFGALVSLSRSEARGWTLGYDGFRPKDGHFTGPNSSAAAANEITRVQFPATQTDMLGMRYTFGKSLPQTQVPVNMPTYSLRAGYIHVQAVGSQAHALSLGGGALFPIRPHVTGNVDVTGVCRTVSGRGYLYHIQAACDRGFDLSAFAVGAAGRQRGSDAFRPAVWGNVAVRVQRLSAVSAGRRDWRPAQRGHSRLQHAIAIFQPFLNF